MARETLERRTLAALDWPRLLQYLAGFARTRGGAAACRALEPQSDLDQVRADLAETSESRGVLSTGRDLNFDGVHDLDDVIKRVRLDAALDPDELIAVARTLRCSRLIKQTINEMHSDLPLLHQRTRRLVSAKGVEHEILRCFDDQGQMLDTASPELERLRARQIRLREQIGETFDRLLDTPAVTQYLQERLVTVRSGRYVVPVKIEHKSRIEGIVHDISSSGASLFIEPREVTRLGNDLRTCELQVRHEETRIRRELSGRVLQVAPGLLDAGKCLIELDAIMARALLAERMSAVEPQISVDRQVVLRAARHPLLVLAGDEVVPNDLEIGPATTTLVVTGPNTGGKTVLLKTLGLFALMARTGMHLPCGDGSQIALFGAVFADIGDEQSLEAHLSSFSAHLETIREILAGIDERSLVLLDEVGEGTDPRQGVALATALLEVLASRDCRTMVTTHFAELAALAESREGFDNGSVEFDERRMVPTYRFLPRVPGRSSALSIARKLGLPVELIDRAEQLVGSGASLIEGAIERLDRERQKLIDQSNKAAQYAHQAAEEREKQRKITRRLRERREELQRRTAENIRREADRARQKIKTALAAFRSEPSDRTAQGAREEIRLVERLVVQAAPEKSSQRKTIESVLIHDWSALRPGDEVVVAPMNAHGKLVTGPDHRSEVRVQLGSAVITLAADDVALPLRGASGGSETITRISLERETPADAATLGNDANRLDLRGTIAEEALARTQYFLDRAMRDSRGRVTIIHGHGSGVLKGLVREYLTQSPYVASWRPGERGEGGGGVAIVELELL
ncbi:MAG: endonuclease MutS2 [Candidatus Alcyoniella australis]|nr:endonuclease MutS2 [Candidatus Alcyoniella australis]